MNKQHFHTLLTRYQSGHCTQQEKQLVEQWFSLLGTEEIVPSQTENEQLQQKIWNAIQIRQSPVSDFPDQTSKSLFNWGWVAAAVLLLGLLWVGYEVKLRTPGSGIAHQVPAGLHSITNTSARAMGILLEDSSRITLSPGSTVHYPVRFETGQRAVYLRGRALFDVRKNPAKPFLVYTGQLAARVLGTSFWVDQKPDGSQVAVAVLTGKVAVFARDENKPDEKREEVVLTPNQQATYSLQTKKILSGLVPEPVMPASYEKAFVFEDAALPAVFGLIEKAYGIQVILENEKLKGCLFTADIGRQPLRIKLDLICSSVNAKYQIRGTKIFVSGKGCQ